MTDFEFYIDEYGGMEIEDIDEFSRCAKKAKLFITGITHTEPDFEDDDVKACVCALAEVYSGLLSNGVLKEKIDGFETEYQEDSLNEILMHTAKLYLPPILLYRGF